jgi:uncharacterized protein
MTDIDQKYYRLLEIIRAYDGILVAFSGGVDSALLAYAAKEALNTKAVAVTFNSPLIAVTDDNYAAESAAYMGLNWRHIFIDSLQIPEIAQNDCERCYYCKKNLWEKLKIIAEEEGISVIADGSNVEDLMGQRPGNRASTEAGIIHPLAQAGFTKAEIRELAAQFNLPAAYRPAKPCLATRFPYDTSLTEEALSNVAKGEVFLSKTGFSDLRLRVHNDICRIEVLPDEFPLLMEVREEIIIFLKALGYKYISCDLGGLNSGNMD